MEPFHRKRIAAFGMSKVRHPIARANGVSHLGLNGPELAWAGNDWRPLRNVTIVINRVPPKPLKSCLEALSNVVFSNGHLYPQPEL